MFRRVVPVMESEPTGAGQPVRALLYGHHAWGGSDVESRENAHTIRPPQSQLAVFHATDAAKIVYGQPPKDVAQKPKLVRPKSSSTLRSGSTQRGSLSSRRLEKELVAQHDFAQGLLTSLSQNMLGTPITAVEPKHKRGQSMGNVKVDPPSASASTSLSVSPSAPVMSQPKPSVSLLPDTSFDSSAPSSIIDRGQDSDEDSPQRRSVSRIPSPKSTERPSRRANSRKESYSPVHTSSSLDIVMSQLDDELHLRTPPRNTTVIGFLSDSLKLESSKRDEAITVPLRVFVEGFSRHLTTFTLPASHTLADARKAFGSSKYLPGRFVFLKDKDVVHHTLEPQLSVLLFAPDIVLRPLPEEVLTAVASSVEVDVAPAASNETQPEPEPSLPEVPAPLITLADLADTDEFTDSQLSHPQEPEPTAAARGSDVSTTSEVLPPPSLHSSPAVVAVPPQPPLGALFRFDGIAFVPVEPDPPTTEPSTTQVVPPTVTESESLLFNTPSVDEADGACEALANHASPPPSLDAVVCRATLRISPMKAASPVDCLQLTHPFGIDIDGEEQRPVFNYRRASIRGSASVAIHPERPQRKLRYSLTRAVSDIAVYDAPHAKTFDHLVVDVGVDSVSVLQERSQPDFIITPVVAPNVSFGSSPNNRSATFDASAIVTSPVHPLFAKQVGVTTPIMDDGATDAGDFTANTSLFPETPASAASFGGPPSAVGFGQGSVEFPMPSTVDETGESEGDDDANEGDSGESEEEDVATYQGSSVAGDSITGQQTWADPTSYDSAHGYSGYPDYSGGYGYDYSGQQAGYSGYDYSNAGYGYPHMPSMGYQQYVPVPVPVHVPVPTPVQMVSPYASMYDMRALSAMGSHHNLFQAQLSPSASSHALVHTRDAPGVSPMSDASSFKIPALDTRASVASVESGGDFVVRAPGKDSTKLFAGLQITPMSDELRSMAFGEEKQE